MNLQTLLAIGAAFQAAGELTKTVTNIVQGIEETKNNIEELLNRPSEPTKEDLQKLYDKIAAQSERIQRLG